MCLRRMERSEGDSAGVSFNMHLCTGCRGRRLPEEGQGWRVSDLKSLATVHLTSPMQRMPRMMGVGRMARLESVGFKIS